MTPEIWKFSSARGLHAVVSVRRDLLGSEQVVLGAGRLGPGRSRQNRRDGRDQAGSGEPSPGINRTNSLRVHEVSPISVASARHMPPDGGADAIPMGAACVLSLREVRAA